MVQIPVNGGVILKTPCNVSAGDEIASCNVQRDLIRLGRVCRGSLKALSIVTVRLNLRLVNYCCRYDTVSSGSSLTASLTATSDSIRGVSSFHTTHPLRNAPFCKCEIIFICYSRFYFFSIL